MLSKAAFNALLKTLEEPPLDVVFTDLATTETEKVPVIVIQDIKRFTLKRVDLNLISEHLVNIAKEDYSLDSESANII